MTDTMPGGQMHMRPEVDALARPQLHGGPKPEPPGPGPQTPEADEQKPAPAAAAAGAAAEPKAETDEIKPEAKAEAKAETNAEHHAEQHTEPHTEPNGQQSSSSAPADADAPQPRQLSHAETHAADPNAANMVPAPPPPPEPDMNNLPEKPLPKHQQKHALMTIKAVKRLKDARPFLRPVNPVALNIPFYFNYIKRPMDLSTIERKLSASAFETPEQVTQDFNLMVENCIRFNGPQAVISQMARNIQAAFEKHMLNMPARDAPPVKQPRRRKTSAAGADDDLPVVIRRAQTHNGRPKREIHPPKSKDIYPYETRKPKSKKLQRAMKFCQQLVRELVSKKYASFNYPFLEPVDPVALNCPTYFDYVKQPMDLGTVGSNLNNWKYQSMDEFERDVRLVFQNCYTFNPEGTIVNMMGHRLEDVFNSRWADRPVVVESDSESDRENGYLSGADAAGLLLDSDLSESESDIDETSITNPAIQYLEEQLTRMKVELQQLKRQELDRIRKERRLARGPRRQRGGRRKRRDANGGGGGGGGGSAAANGATDAAAGAAANGSSAHGPGRRRKKLKTVVTYDMKRIITEHINDLPAAKLEKVIGIIKKCMPQLREDEEVELDLDTLDNNTILTLYNTFFREFDNGSAAHNGYDGVTNGTDGASLSPTSAAAAAAAGISKKRRSKALSQEEQNRQIEKIKNKLALLDGASPISSNGSPSALQGAHNFSMSSSSSGDDDDDDASSESEEE